MRVIARLDDDLEGTELPILALDDPTGIRRRTPACGADRVGDGSVVVAVYPALVAGRYRIVVPNGRAADAPITGGEVTTIDLRTTVERS